MIQSPMRRQFRCNRWNNQYLENFLAEKAFTIFGLNQESNPRLLKRSRSCLSLNPTGPLHLSTRPTGVEKANLLYLSYKNVSDIIGQ